MSGHRIRLLSLAVVVLAAVSAFVLLKPAASTPPDIQGAILPEAKPLPTVELVDHHGNTLVSDDFDGRWHLLSYGFTHCPDICPTMLSELARFRKLLDGQQRFGDLQVLFYSIDPLRDSAEQLANYVPWFDRRFVGLRADDPVQAERFEQSLGMQSFITLEEGDNYQVAHGFRLYLLDDQGRLRASLAPSSDRDGRKYYEPERLLQDYLAIRRWIAG